MVKLLSENYSGIAQSTNLLANWLIVTGKMHSFLFFLPFLINKIIIIFEGSLACFFMPKLQMFLCMTNSVNFCI